MLDTLRVDYYGHPANRPDGERGRARATHAHGQAVGQVLVQAVEKAIR